MKKALLLSTILASVISASNVETVSPAINVIPNNVTFTGDLNAIIAGTDMDSHNELFAVYGNLGVQKDFTTFGKLTLSGALTVSGVGNFNLIDKKDLMTMIYQGGKSYTGVSEGYLKVRGPNGDMRVGRMILNEDLMGKNDWEAFLPTSFDGIMFTGHKNGLYSKLGYFTREQGYYTSSVNPMKSVKLKDGVMYSNIGYKNNLFDVGLSSVYTNSDNNVFMQYASVNLKKWTNKNIKVSEQYLKYADSNPVFDDNDVFGLKVDCQKGNVYGSLAYNYLDKMTRAMYSADPLFTSTVYGAAYGDRKVNAGVAKVGYLFGNVGFAKNTKADISFGSYKGDFRNTKVYELNAQTKIKNINLKTSVGYIHNDMGKTNDITVAKVTATYKF